MNKIERIKQEKLSQMKKDLNAVTGEELKKVIEEYIDTAFEYGYKLGHDMGYDIGYSDGKDDEDDLLAFVDDDTPSGESDYGDFDDIVRGHVI
jgi:hypothetical protein